MLLFTTLNTVGRMVGGYLPEVLLHRYGTPRCASYLQDSPRHAVFLTWKEVPLRIHACTCTHSGENLSSSVLGLPKCEAAETAP